MVDRQPPTDAGARAAVGTLRRGLPRTPGGEPWPPAALPVAASPVDARADGVDARLETTGADAEASAPAPGLSAAPSPHPRPAEGSASVGPASALEGSAEAAPPLEATAAGDRSRLETTAAARATSIRRGLPRVAGGEPWPPAGRHPLLDERAGRARLEGGAAEPAPAPAGAETAPPPSTTGETAAASAEGASARAALVEEGATARSHVATAAAAGATAIRRGLPRVAGGDPWPPAAAAPARAATDGAAPAGPASTSPAPTSPAPASPAPAAVGPRAAERADGARPEGAAAATPAAAARAGVEPAPAASGLETAPSAPARPAETTAPAAPAAPARPAEEERPAARAPERPAARAAQPPAAKAARAGEDTAPGLRPVGARQWIAASVLVALAVVGLATIVVAIVRWIIGLEPVAAFIERYPGTYPLPEGAPVGIPAWLNWAHFFNILLIALVIRSGLQVRRERKPPAYFTSRRTGAKVSLTVWLHTSVDVLWVVNGIVFVVLLFATGQWVRTVPTSWEVFPHAISAALQYASLDWPLEDGWVHYNAMQQLAYFATVFIAAPLAIVTGVRMSGWWPKDAERLNRAYPIEWARAVHFPTMLYFVAFIIVHVLLVFTTGALRNLNHMFAAKPDDDWLGFLFFSGAMLVTAGAVLAARPALLSPIASRFGTVSAR